MLEVNVKKIVPLIINSINFVTFSPHLSNNEELKFTPSNKVVNLYETS
jgi:hypothetical protein